MCNCQVKIFLSGYKNQVQAAEQDENAADFFENDCSFGFFAPVHVVLDEFGAGAGKYNHRAMADAVEEKQGDAVSQTCRGDLECYAEHWGHKSESARPQRDAEYEAEDEGGQHAFAFETDITRSGERHWDYV